MIGWPNGSLRLAECDAKAEIRADRTRRNVHLARASLAGQRLNTRGVPHDFNDAHIMLRGVNACELGYDVV